MIVLHAGVLEDRLAVWAETPAGSPPLASGSRSRSARKNRPARMPFDAGDVGILAAIEGTPSRNPGSTPEMTEAVVRLPTVGHAPLASSPLVAETFASSPPQSRTQHRPTLTPWVVSALRLPIQGAVELLCHCVGKDALGPGIFLGKDMSF